MSFFRLEKKERRKRGPRPRDILPSHCRPAFFICIQCRRRHPRGFEPFPALSTRPIIRMSFNMAAHRNYPTNRANACPRILSLLFHSFLAERRIEGNWNERDWREGRLKGGVPPPPSLRNNAIWWQQLRFMKSNPMRVRDTFHPSTHHLWLGGEKRKEKN